MIDYLRILLHARLDRDERGASAVEYGLLVAGIAAVIILAVFLLGGTINDMFTDTNDRLENGGTPATPTSTSTP